MVIYPEGVWYHYDSREDVDEILQTHLIDGGRVERLYITKAGGRARHFVFQVHPWEKAADWTARSRNKTFSAMQTTKTR